MQLILGNDGMEVDKIIHSVHLPNGLLPTIPPVLPVKRKVTALNFGKASTLLCNPHVGRCRIAKGNAYNINSLFPQFS